MKKLRLLGITLGLSLLIMCPAVSAEPISLDDVGKTQQTQVEQNTGSSGLTSAAAKESTEFMKELEQSADLSEGKETAEKVAAPLKNVVAIIVQVLAYVITIGLALRVVLDLTYISLPFTRVVLGNGFTGSAQNASQPPMMNGGMGGMNGGFGGGYNSGFGSGFGSGYGMGRSLGQQVGMSGQTGMANQANSNSRIQWISSAALNAVASEGTLGADGRQMSAYKIYIKDMLVILILTPILLVLAVTGTLTELGFLVGTVVSNMIQGAGNMI